jgi:hypothetical protein
VGGEHPIRGKKAKFTGIWEKKTGVGGTWVKQSEFSGAHVGSRNYRVRMGVKAG